MNNKSKNKLYKSLSLIERMDKHLTMSEAEMFINNIEEKEKTYPHSDDIFDLYNIPIEKLDALWLPLDAFNLGLPYRHPLRQVVETVDYKSNIEKTKEVITNTYNIDDSLFVIKEGYNGMYAAILMALKPDNITVIENAMRKLGYYRANPTDNKLLEDVKKRLYVNLRFEPINAKDLTDYVRENYSNLYHTTPSIFEEKIIKEGLKPSNSNAEFKYNEPRVYLIKDNANDNEKQELINELYQQAKQRGYENLNPNYTMFTIDLNKIPITVHFYGDINEDKGLYITNPILPNTFKKIEHYTAQE